MKAMRWMMLSAILSLVLPVCPACGEDLSVPLLTTDDSLPGGRGTTWTTTLFGSYPQAEVVPDEDITCIDPEIITPSDFIIDPDLYEALQSASWKGDETTLEGQRFLRMNGNAAQSCSADRTEHYHWNSPEEYHYFLYEPIRWRILALEEGKALLLSDKLLDAKPYHLFDEPVTWATSTLRSWLNGYPAEENAAALTYEGEGFLDLAFSDMEKEAICPAELHTKENSQYQTDQGPDTVDSIFLLSNEEVFDSPLAGDYGFYPGSGVDDPARRFQATTYAKCRGAWWSLVPSYEGNTFWFMRTTGYTPLSVTYICDFGYIYQRGTLVSCNDAGILPALWVDVEKAGLSYEGTVYSGDICQGHAPSPAKPWESLAEPQVTEAEGLPGNKQTTYSLLSFGSYPQSEVTDEELLKSLAALSFTENTTTHEGERYQRIEKEGKARYYRYDPITWRIWELADQKALLVTDKALLSLPFHEEMEDTSWKESSLRSYLNGYDQEENTCQRDYSLENFLDSAFTEEEQKAIVPTALRARNNYYFGTGCGDDTVDLLFLPQEEDVFATETAIRHGFATSDAVHDMARRISATDYAKATGAFFSSLPETEGKVFWFLRTSGYTPENVVYVDENGCLFNRGIPVTTPDASLLLCLRLDLTKDVYSLQGTWTE